MSSLYSVRVVSVTLPISRQSDDAEFVDCAQVANVSAVIGQTIDGQTVISRLSLSTALSTVELGEALNLLRTAYVDRAFPAPSAKAIRSTYGRVSVDKLDLPHTLSALC